MSVEPLTPAERAELETERATIRERYERIRDNYRAIEKGRSPLDRPSFGDHLLDIYRRQLADIERLLENTNGPERSDLDGSRALRA